MCGLVGIIAKQKSGIFKTHTDVFQQLLWADQVRGMDGTGMMFNVGKDTVRILKQPGPAGVLFAAKAYDKTISNIIQKSNFVFGHNRSATSGKKVWADTHPFAEKHITLIHNGTLHTHKELSKEATVDSQAIAQHLAEQGTKETIKAVNGAFALIWTDTQEGTLNLCRNYDRPLYLLDAGPIWIVSSEEELGKWIAKRNNFNVTTSVSLLPGMLYSFDMKKDDYTEYKTEKLDLYSFQNKNKHFSMYQGCQEDFDTPYWNKVNKGNSFKKSDYYYMGDKIRFSLVPAPQEDKTLPPTMLHRTEKGFAYLVGKIVGGKREHLVMVFGTEAHLTDLAKGSLFEGYIAAVKIKDNFDHYTARDVKDITNVSTVVNLPVIVEQKNVACAYCGNPVDTSANTKDTHIKDDFWSCERCEIDSMSMMTAGYC